MSTVVEGSPQSAAPAPAGEQAPGRARRLGACVRRRARTLITVAAALLIAGAAFTGGYLTAAAQTPAGPGTSGFDPSQMGGGFPGGGQMGQMPGQTGGFPGQSDSDDSSDTGSGSTSDDATT